MSNLAFSFSGIYGKVFGKDKLLVEGTNFSLKENSSLAIIGESGSGKSMLGLSIIDNLPSNCNINDYKLIIDEENILKKDVKKFLGKEIIYIPQNGLEHLNPSLKLKKSFYDILKIKGFNKKNYLEEIKNRLNLVKIDDLSILDKYPFEISGGTAQKLILAMSYSENVKLVIADEITNGIDENSKNELSNLFFELYKNSSKIVITHDLDLAKKCDEIMIMNDSIIIEKGTNDILKSPKSPYLTAFMESSTSNETKAFHILRDEESNCPFYKRCQVANENCKNEIPKHLENNHYWRCIYD